MSGDLRRQEEELANTLRWRWRGFFKCACSRAMYENQVCVLCKRVYAMFSASHLGKRVLENVGPRRRISTLCRRSRARARPSARARARARTHAHTLNTKASINAVGTKIVPKTPRRVMCPQPMSCACKKAGAAAAAASANLRRAPQIFERRASIGAPGGGRWLVHALTALKSKRSKTEESLA